ncbi:fatty acyl-CoA reductase 1-like [Aphomia sociella]
MAALSDEVLRIPRFYAGRHVFITGATGFMGKVLVERLLTTCPDVGRLFLLMRESKNLNTEERLRQLKESPVFDLIRQRDPDQLEKLHVIHGDITQPRLGISNESLVDLQEVSIVFHTAATVKFNEELRKAIVQNVVSVIGLLDICDKLPHVQALVHVSTAYSNAELSVVEEKVYPLSAPLKELLELVDDGRVDSEDVQKYIAPKPNTYTFTKAMAEHAVQQHGNIGYPIAIFRPTIVISSHRHPFPGWTDNRNGVAGVVVGVGAGLLHVFHCNGSKKSDMLPVDIAIDTLIAVAWDITINKSATVKVYNCSMSENPTSWGEFQRSLNYHTRYYPHSNLFWYPFIYAIKNRKSICNLDHGSVIYGHGCGAARGGAFASKQHVVHCLHISSISRSIPGHHTILRAKLFILTIPKCPTCNSFNKGSLNMFGTSKRLNFISVGTKFRNMNAALHYFALREWRFENENVRKLRERLHPSEAELFNVDPRSVNWDELYSNFVNGVRKYLLKEKDDDLPRAKLRMRRVHFLHNVMKICLPVLLFRLLKKKHREDITNKQLKQLIDVCILLFLLDFLLQ